MDIFDLSLEGILAHRIDAILGLVEKFGGAMIYGLSYSSILRESRKRAIWKGKAATHLPKK